MFCGELRRDDGDCSKCGAWSAASIEDGTPDIGFPCPRCGDSHSLEKTPFGRSVIKLCARCRGFFVPALQMSQIINDYIVGLPLPLGDHPPPPPTVAVAASRVPTVTCIACHRDMDRVNFAARSGAIIDICNMHGIWLDAGELVPVLHFIKTRAERGMVPMSENEIESEADAAMRRAVSNAAIAHYDGEIDVGYGYRHQWTQIARFLKSAKDALIL